jgi:pimeloyl-ACP methyl ester carboxylesterase
VSIVRQHKWLIALASVVAIIGICVSLVWSSIRPPLINVDGSLVEARVLGNGAPTVVFELGAAGGHLAYWRVQSAVSKYTRTLVYERAGLGRSSLRHEPRSAEQIALELHALLAALHIPPPYVLVGHSYGGLLVRVFAHRYPTEIAGLIFVDPATEGYYDYMMKETPREWAAAADAKDEGFREQWVAIPEALDEARRAWPLPQVPVTILTAGRPLGEWPLRSEKDLERFHQEQLVLAARIAGAKLVSIPAASHMSILQNDQLAQEIVEIVRKTRVGR